MTIAFMDLAPIKTEGRLVSYDDILVTIASLKDEIEGYKRLRLKRRLLDTLTLAEQEITDLRARNKPRLVKRRRS